jgi:hypothetical protein
MDIIKPILPFTLAFLAAILLLNFFYERSVLSAPKAEELALGQDNTAYFAQDNGYNFHCGDFLYFPIPDCVQDFNAIASPAKQAYLLMGNSQLHGINQPELGLSSTSEILYGYFKERDSNKNFLTFSMPNMNMQEQFLLFEYAQMTLPLEKLLLAVSFDNTRETGIREGLLDALEEPEIKSNLKTSESGQKILDSYGDTSIEDLDLPALKDTPQKSVEFWLNSRLSSFWNTWEARGSLRAISLIKLYQFRNYIFGIDSSSTRKKIPARYDANLLALKELLARAKTLEIDIVLYSAPIRGDAKLPYDLKEYQDFKLDLQALTVEHDFTFVDLQQLVPAQYWGEVDSLNSTSGSKEIDFMHFQGFGHQILGDHLKDLLIEEGWDR